jgi:protein CpxP
MSYFNRNKWWAIAFLLLIAFNVATLIAFWLIRDKRSGPPPGQGAGVVEFLSKELGFDSVQKEKLAHLHDVHQMKMRELRKNNRDAKNDFFDLLQQENITDSTLQKAAQASTKFEEATDILTFRHFQQVRGLCTEAQKKKFDSVIQEVLRMNAPPPPGAHPGPPPPRRGEGLHDGPPPEADERRPPPPQQ